jgi:DNA invertase Pin-like site-specific DNA recombinase
MQVRVGSGAAQRNPAKSYWRRHDTGEIDLQVWRLDRWGRSIAYLQATLQELEHLGVGFVSLTEALDLTTRPVERRPGLLGIFADNAERAIMQSHSAEVAV